MTKTEILKKEDRRSYLIRVTTRKDVFDIPVIDVRDGEKERKVIKRILKAAGTSKFMRPTWGAGGGSYQVSRK